MRKVVQPGKALSASQRRQLDLQARMRAVAASPLRSEIDAFIAELDKDKEQGVRHERLYSHVETKTGTISVVDWIGH